MIAGSLYLATDPDLTMRREAARRLWQQYNATAPDAQETRRAILDQLIGTIGADVAIEPPFYCDYGSQIELGPAVFINMNCVFLDPAAIRIGAQTLIGPSVQIYTATHPLDAATRAEGPELALPVTLGSRVWLGGAVVVCPGVTIGDDTTVGAGSVVTRDLPARVLAAGNPCRVIREL